MILIYLLYRRFDNLLRMISEIVTRGIVLAIRERDKQDKKAGRQFRVKISLIRCTILGPLVLFPVGLTHNF
jgi:hypothetical protein